MAGMIANNLRSGDVYFIRDDGALAWYSRIQQAGMNYGHAIDVVPTHCGFFFNWDPFIRPTSVDKIFMNLELCNMQGKGTCVECNDPYIRIGKKNNCPGIMCIFRPWLVDYRAGVKSFTGAPFFSYYAEWFFSEILCLQMKSIGKTDYDFGYVASAFIGGLGAITFNPFIMAFQKIRQQVKLDNRYVCSTWVIEVLLMLASYRYAMHDIYWYGKSTPKSGWSLAGMPNIPPSQRNLEMAVMSPLYNPDVVCTPWTLKNQIYGAYYPGTYGQGLLTGAHPAP